MGQSRARLKLALAPLVWPALHQKFRMPKLDRAVFEVLRNLVKVTGNLCELPLKIGTQRRLGLLAGTLRLAPIVRSVGHIR